jgi:predicted nuclease of predicted toxin-antitoxin system
VKLLLDENLSRRIVPFLQAVFPGSSQVVLEGLEQAEDGEVWQFARDNGFVIVTKDSDFHELSLLKGAPPKVVWLRAGNGSKAEIVRLLLENAGAINVLATDDEVGCIEIE